MRRRLGIGVDVGATKIRVCVGYESGELIWRKSTDMPTPGRVERYVGQLVERVREGVSKVPAGERVSGIGVASVGPLDLHRGGMDSPANLPYKFVPLMGPIGEAFGARVALMNDANAAVLGEKKFGAGKREDNLVYITISTGIGGGAIVDGHLLSGKDGNAGEVGHVVVDPRGRLTCGCGRRGHWEAYCSGRNIPNLASVLAEEHADAVAKGGLQDLLGIRGGEVNSATILRRASQGNEFAKRVAEEMGELNALGVANTVNVFDPALITMGGGVALNNPRLVLAPVRRLVPKNAINRPPRIILTPLGEDVVLLGALSLAFKD